MAFGLVELVVLSVVIFGLPGLILWIWSLVDALRRSDSEWEQAGQNKLVWTLVLVFTGFVGAVIYLLVARPRLKEFEHRL